MRSLIRKKVFLIEEWAQFREICASLPYGLLIQTGSVKSNKLQKIPFFSAEIHRLNLKWFTKSVKFILWMKIPFWKFIFLGGDSEWFFCWWNRIQITILITFVFDTLINELKFHWIDGTVSKLHSIVFRRLFPTKMIHSDVHIIWIVGHMMWKHTNACAKLHLHLRNHSFATKTREKNLHF